MTLRYFGLEKYSFRRNKALGCKSERRPSVTEILCSQRSLLRYPSGGRSGGAVRRKWQSKRADLFAVGRLALRLIFLRDHHYKQILRHRGISRLPVDMLGRVNSYGDLRRVVDD